MYACWLESEYPDSVFIHLPYISYAAQHTPKGWRGRAEYLNNAGEIVHRHEHQIGFAQAAAAVRRSGVKKDTTSGFKCTYFRIDFPEDSNFVDDIYGKSGSIRLHSIGLEPESQDLEGINFDIEWHVKKYESTPRYGEDHEDEDSEDDKKDFVASATKGMGVDSMEDK